MCSRGAQNVTDNYVVFYTASSIIEYQQQRITVTLLPPPCTYILNGWVLVSGDVTSSRHSVFIKFNSDSPGFARCCLWNTFRALWAPKGPQTRDRISSFDCPSNFVKYLLISIMLTLRFASRQLFSSSCFKIISVVLYANTWWRPCKLHFFNHYKLRPWYVFQWNERWSNVLFSVYKYNLFKKK